MSVFKTLPTAFPWYDDIRKQDRFKEHRGNISANGLISPMDALLPFEFYRIGTPDVTTWEVFDVVGDTLVATLDPAPLRTASREGKNYIYFPGTANFKTNTAAMNLPSGHFYSVITFVDFKKYFSEVFHVPKCTLTISSLLNMEFLKLEWYNDSDIRPIFYNDKDANGVPYFRNVVYLDTFVHASEPEIEEEGEPDGNDDEIPTFQKAIIRYRITDLVPDFLKKALVLMKMHDHVILTTRNGLESGELNRLTTSTAPEFNGAYSTIDILFEEDLAFIKKGCPDNMQP